MIAADDWSLTPKQAVQRQRELARRVVLEDHFDRLRHVAGVDVGFPTREVTRAAVVVLSFPALEPVAQTVIEQPTRFPYVPGLLSFREVPAMVAALAELTVTPDVILVDGHGTAHPRRFGSACHLALVTGVPAAGVGKSRLCGTHAEPGEARGDVTPLSDGDDLIGHVVRTRRRVRPVFVSPGSGISHASAIELVLDCAPRFRLPEPIRLADRLASARGD